jgi:hypothetical protein
MAGKLIMLPFRVWYRSARLLTRAAGGAAERAIALAGQTLGAAASNGSRNGHPSDWQRGSSATAETGWREESIDEPVSPVDVEHPHDEAESRRQPSPTPPRPRDAEPAEPVRPLDAEAQAPRVAEPEAPPVAEAQAPPVAEPEAPPVAEPGAPPVPEPVHVSEEPELVREAAEPGAEDGAGAQLTVMEPWNGYARMNAREVIARARQASPAELAAVRLYESRHRSRQTVLAAVDRQLKLAGGGSPA